MMSSNLVEGGRITVLLHQMQWLHTLGALKSLGIKLSYRYDTAGTL